MIIKVVKLASNSIRKVV